jgi:hypothetical protein
MTRTERSVRAARRLLPLAGLLLAAACGGDPLSPFQPEVANATDSFQLQATGLTGVSASLEYPWTNTGDRADVNIASQVAGGTATLRVYDPDGVLREQRSLTENGTFQTTAGRPGTWRIVLLLQSVRGTLNFRVQRHA